MFSVDQTHLRRYFATLGIAIAAGTLSLAGLFMQLQQELTVSQSTLATLTPTARNALLKRQEYLALGTTLLPWFVLVGFIGGIGLSVYGIIGWTKRQQILDEREDIGLRKDRFELRQLSENEKVVKLDQEAKESVPEATYSNAKTTSGQVSSARETIMAVEILLIDKLTEEFGASHVKSASVVKTSTGLQQQVDAIVEFPRRRPIFLEVKYASNERNALNRIRDGLMRISDLTAAVDGRGVLVLIWSDDFSVMKADQLRRRAEEMSFRFARPIRVYSARYSDFAALSAKEFADFIDPVRGA